MRILRRWLPAAIICLLIFMSSARHGTAVSQDYYLNYLANKIAHVILYFALCFSFYRGTKNITIAITLTILYGISDEVHQQFVPTRTGRISDVIIDGGAAVAAGYILWKYYQNLPTKLKSWLRV